MLRTRCLAMAAAALLCAPLHPVRAQTTPRSLGDALHGTTARVFLVTIGPGSLLWERFGHTAIIIHDPARDVHTAYNWGIFDFRGPTFWLDFIMGRPHYLMGGDDADEMLASYEQTGRAMTVQALELTDAQTVALERSLAFNARPEHRSYPYDYYLDNCSTRARDALDDVLGGTIRAATIGRRTTITYRSETRRLLEAVPWASLGTTLVFGPGVDRPLSAWDAMFIPMRLRDELRALRTAGTSGAPLVTQEWSIPAHPDLVAHHYIIAPDIVVTIIASGAVLLIILVAWYARDHDHPIVERTAWGLVACWMMLIGIAGLVILFGWLFTAHVFVRNNENVLLANPLALWVAWALFRLVAKPSPNTRVAAARASVVLSGVAIAAVALYLLPLTHQANGEIIVLIVPSTLATAAVLMGGARSRERCAVESSPLTET